MLAYRHQFHAGNAADVFKHVLLVRLLLALRAKDAAFLYLDTHAGAGRYDLTHPWARKTAEFKRGIELLWPRADLPALLAPYLEAVRAENQSAELRYYPGSPRIASGLLRAQDRAELVELNRADYEELSALCRGDRRLHVSHMDGFQALKAFLPPRERRALVFIDAAFDRTQEMRRITAALKGAQRRCATGVYAVWYPLLEPVVMRALERDIIATQMRKILQAELALHPQSWTKTMRGSGLLILNPPWKFDREAQELLPWLWRVLSPEGEGGHRLRWLVPE